MGQQEPDFPAVAGAPGGRGGGRRTAVSLRSLEGYPTDCVLRSPCQRLRTQHPEKGSMERAKSWESCAFKKHDSNKQKRK